jgi:hypothetical protein
VSALSILFIAIFCCGFGVDQNSRSIPHPIAIVADYSQAGTSYAIDSKHVSLGQCSRILGDMLKKRGRETPVVVLVDERISFQRMQELKGVVDKAGASAARYFVFGADRARMQQINLGRGVPYSLNPTDIPSKSDEKY